MVRYWLGRLRGVFLIVYVLLVWQFISGVIFPHWRPYYQTMMPPPTLVFAELVQLLQRGVLLSHILASLQRVFAGFLIAAAVGIPLGALIGSSRVFAQLLDPLVEILRPIPPLAWIPLSILWFGIGNTQNTYIIFLACFFPVVLNTISGIRGVDRIFVSATITLGARPRHIFLDVIVPGALPSIITGLRIGLGIGWMALVAAELVAARSGLGFMIEDARYLLNSERVIAGMITIGLLGFLMDRGMRVAERQLTPWQAGLKVAPG